MNSFYGGKQGAPFILVNSYATVDEMAESFKRGFEYKGVQFDEYVIINTVNKNNPDNGRIYRRGYNLDLTELDPNDLNRRTERSTGGGIYIGTVVGPAGHAPQFNLTTMEAVEQQKNEWDEQTWDVRKGSGLYAPIENLVPGYTGPNATDIAFEFNSNDFTDDIKWNFISIRDQNNSDTNVFVGFKIPYTVFNYTANSESPYYHRSNQTDNFINKDLIDRQSISENHPFYEYWDIKIPKGIKGDAFKNFRIVEANENDNVQKYDGQNSDREQQNTDGRDRSNRKILVYDYYHYDQEENGQPVSLYLGDYNMIKSIYLDDDGTFEVNYTHNDADKWLNIINWINKVELNSETGVFKVTYNNNTVEGANAENNKVYTVQLRWVKGATIQDDGSLTLHYTVGNDTNDGLKKIKWITDITLNEDGTVTIFYNNETPETIFDKKLKWIKSIDIDDTGLLTIQYNNETPNFTYQFNWPTDISIADDGTITTTYSKNDDKVVAKKVKWVKDIRINDANEGNQKISIQYNNNSAWNDIGSPINYIKEVAVRENDAMLLVYYSDPKMRENGVFYNNKNGWQELQTVRDYSGFKLGQVLNYVVSSEEEAINLLNQSLPNGFIEEINATKAAIIKYNNAHNFFGFDYVEKTWKFIGSLYDSMPTNLVATENDINIEELKRELSTGGIWFVEENE